MIAKRPRCVFTAEELARIGNEEARSKLYRFGFKFAERGVTAHIGERIIVTGVAARIVTAPDPKDGSILVAQELPEDA